MYGDPHTKLDADLKELKAEKAQVVKEAEGLQKEKVTVLSKAAEQKQKAVDESAKISRSAAKNGDCKAVLSEFTSTLVSIISALPSPPGLTPGTPR